MRIAMDNVESLWALLQCSFDKCTTTVLITGLTGCEPQACEPGPIITQTGIDRFHDLENAFKLARTAIEDQITTKCEMTSRSLGLAAM